MSTTLSLVWELALLCVRRPCAPSGRHRVLPPSLARAHRVRLFTWALMLGLVVTVLLTRPAMAAGFAVFDPIVDIAANDSTTWFSRIVGLVRPMFILLGTLEICWAAAIWAFEKDSLNSLAIEIIKKIMFIGFFYALLQFAPEWIPDITNSFEQAGEAAAGTGPVSTDGIVNMGVDVIAKIWAQTIAFITPLIIIDPEEILGTANPVAYAGLVYASAIFILTIVATIVIAIAYVVVAAQYFTLKIETYVLFAVGAIFLGLGSSSWTKEYVTKYLNYAINVGVRLLVLILILSLTLNAVNNMANGFGWGKAILTFQVGALINVICAAVLQAILGIKAPEMAGALLSGGSGLTAGSITGTVLSTMSNLRMAGLTGGGGGAAAAARSAGAGAGRSGGAGGGGAPGAPGAGAGAGQTSSLRDAVGAGRGTTGMGPTPQADRSGAAATLGGLGASLAQPARLSTGTSLPAATSGAPGSALSAATNAGSNPSSSVVSGSSQPGPAGLSSGSGTRDSSAGGNVPSPDQTITPADSSTAGTTVRTESSTPVSLAGAVGRTDTQSAPSPARDASPAPPPASPREA